MKIEVVEVTNSYGQKTIVFDAGGRTPDLFVDFEYDIVIDLPPGTYLVVPEEQEKI